MPIGYRTPGLRLVVALAILGGTAAACGSLPVSLPFLSEERPAAPWPLVVDGDDVFVKAGTRDGLVTGSPLTFVDGGGWIVGSGRVAHVWDDLAKVERERWDPEIELAAALMARPREPSDEAALAELPPVGEVEEAAAAPAAAPRRASAPSEGAAAPQPVELPADLRTGSADDRIEALTRYEDEPRATAWIVEVMKHDPDYEVRKKAWRVVRARWRRGTGSAAEHERAALWAAAHGDRDVRLEAVSALGKRSSRLANATRFLDDPDAEVRKRAGRAAVDIALRTGQADAARKAITAAAESESDKGVKKYLYKLLAEL